MKLDIKDRIIISNQLKLLEKLYPEESTYYAQHRKAIESGFSLHYAWLAENFDDGMTEDECREVLNILEMYRAITYTYDELEEKSEVDDLWLRFSGFDGNNESQQFSYAHYFIFDLGRFEELKYDSTYPNLNSHSPTLHKYRAMLDIWKSMDKPYRMTVIQLNKVLGA